MITFAIVILLTSVVGAMLWIAYIAGKVHGNDVGYSKGYMAGWDAAKDVYAQKPTTAATGYAGYIPGILIDRAYDPPASSAAYTIKGTTTGRVCCSSPAQTYRSPMETNATKDMMFAMGVATSTSVAGS